jgi:prepilin-type N-terminal cleavage/methylation domain-containing protein
MHRPRKNRGFTLIELLIVVVIIGILAAIVIPKFSKARDKGLRASIMSDLKNVASLQEVYYNDHYSYSTDLNALGATLSSGVTLTINSANGTGWGATAVHSGVPNEHCGIYHGNAPPSDGDPATVPGTVTCTF